MRERLGEGFSKPFYFRLFGNEELKPKMAVIDFPGRRLA